MKWPEMAKFYTNENFPLPVVPALHALGHDVLTSLEGGIAYQSIPDEKVFEFACQHQRILLTLNRFHFIRLHKLNTEHFGIIACTFNPDYAGLARRVSEACQQNDPMTGKLLRVNRPG
jgi:hypothetical protein